MSVQKFILAVTLGFLVAGCASTFHEAGADRLAPSQVAVIETDVPLDCFSECLSIQHVDGKFRGIGSFARYELLPGDHELGISYFQRRWGGGVGSGSEITISVTVVAGHTYRIRPNANVARMYWRPEMFDMHSGVVVSKPVRN